MGLTAGQFVSLTDKLGARYLSLLGSPDTGYGFGNGSADANWGFSARTKEYADIILATGDATLVLSLLQTAQNNVNMAITRAVGSLLLADMQGLSQVCAAAGLPGVTNTRTFADYYNTSAGGPYQALVTRAFADLYYLIYSRTSIGPANVYMEAVANLGQKSVGGALVPGPALDDTTVAGMARLFLDVSSSTWTGTGGIVSITGSARTATGNVVAGRTFATAANVNANGTVALVPGTAGDLLLSVSSITLPGAMTAGTVIVRGDIPAGRVDPPV